MEETSDDTLGSRIAEGEAETTESKEETIGRTDEGNCEIWDAKDVRAGPITTELPVGSLTPATMDETREETLGSKVADGVADTWDKRLDTSGRTDDGN
jgi:hypothetical protein